MLEIVSFFEGGLSYNEAMSMPLPELLYVIEYAGKMAARRKAELDKPR